MDLSNIVATIITAITTVTAVILTVQLKKQNDKRMALEKRLSERQVNAYTKLIDLYFNAMTPQSNNKQLYNLKFLLGIKKDIFIYSNDAVFRKFSEWLEIAQDDKSKTPEANKSPDHSPLGLLVDILLEIRKDMHGKETTVTRDDMLPYLVQDAAEVRKKGLI